MAKCTRCGKTWDSKSQAHCTGCCEHFSSVFAFDKHRTGQHDGDRRCKDVQEMQKAKMVFLPENGYWVSAVMSENRVFTKEERPKSGLK